MKGHLALVTARCGKHLLLLPMMIALLGCVHHLRYEDVSTREEAWEEEVFNDAGDLVVTMSDTPHMLTILFERTTRVEQDYRITIEATQVHLPWSPRALAQFGLMSWNPVAWFMPSLWSEGSGRAHPRFRDWLLLWNPFIRTGGGIDDEGRRRVDLRHWTERRQLGTHRLPINRTPVLLTLRVGDLEQRMLRMTDLHGTVRIDLPSLPLEFKLERPLRLEAEVEGRGTEWAELF